MRYALFTVLGTAVIFFAGVYTGVRINESTEAEYPYIQLAAIEPAEITPAEQALPEPNIQPESHAALPEDMFIRLKNEAEVKREKKKTEAVQEEKREEPQGFVRDDKAIAHAEATEGIDGLAKGDYAAAAVRLEKAFDLYPDKAIAAHYLKALIMLGENEKAAEVLSAADIGENTLADIIEIAVQNGRYEAALKLLDISPAKSSRLIHAAGLAHEAVGDKHKAIMLYKQAYAAEPENPALSFSMARAADMEEDYLTALSLYEQTTRLAATDELKRYAALRSTQIREYLPSLGRQSFVSPE